MKKTEGIIPYIQQTADGKPVDRPDLLGVSQAEINELFNFITQGMFDKGKLYKRPNNDGIWRTYMIQQPMETHNID